MLKDCIFWSGSHRKSDGRPLWYDGLQYAYRVLWQQKYGKLPSHILLHHICENLKCINLDHLVPLTTLQHQAIHNSRLTHCSRGHEFNDANSYWRRDRPGDRHCRECSNKLKRDRTVVKQEQRYKTRPPRFCQKCNNMIELWKRSDAKYCASHAA